ncbi:MAG: PilW family protein [Pseudomonadota bacterium]
MNTFRNSQSGMTIVEILIAMLLGLFLVGGVLQVFSSSKQSHRVHEATARMQETGRMGIEIIARDVRMADFWGCASDLNNVTNNLDNAGTGYVDFGSGGLAGTEGAAGAPDTITLRGGFGTGMGIEPPYGPQASANIKVAAGNDLEQSDIVFVADCSSADIFQISNANPGTAGTIVHNTGSATEPGNYNATNPGCPGSNAHCLSKIYGADAQLFEVQEIAYTVATGSEGEPALFRNGQEFLDGVEDLQVLYGEDLDGNGVADYFVAANQVTDMEQVVSIRFAIVARSRNDNLTGGVNQTYTILGGTRTPNDQRLRQTYTSTVNIRNRL